MTQNNKTKTLEEKIEERKEEAINKKLCSKSLEIAYFDYKGRSAKKRNLDNIYLEMEYQNKNLKINTKEKTIQFYGTDMYTCKITIKYKEEKVYVHKNGIEIYKPGEWVEQLEKLYLKVKKKTTLIEKKIAKEIEKKQEREKRAEEEKLKERYGIE